MTQPESTYETLVGQRLLVGFEGLTAPDYIINWLREGRISGVILFARNVESPQQLAALTRSLHDAASYPILVAIDQEGGMVARLRQPEGFTESPGAMALSSAQNSDKYAEAVSRVLADEMRAVGINWTYAPVVDLSYNADNPTVGTRSYGRNPQRVGQIAAAAVRGFQSGGVAACAKHFPGLGDTAVDSHLALPELDTPVEKLIATDLEPYRQVIAAGVASIMTTHTLFTTLDADHPATLSPIIIQQLLRDELNYQGVVTTDCLEMKAITDHYGAGESAVRAALAGVDILLVSHTRALQEEAYAALLDAARSGRLSREQLEQSNERIQALKQRFAIAVGSIEPERVGTQAHRQTALDAARAGVILVKQGDAFPLDITDQKLTIGLVEFISNKNNTVADYGDLSDREKTEQFKRNEHYSLVTYLKKQLPDIAWYPVTTHSGRWSDSHDRLIASVQEYDVLIIATRNAHMKRAQRGLVNELINQAKHSILVCLENPYDADVIDADTVLCTCGDSVPSLQAVTEALLGEFEPTGKNPVKVVSK